MPALATAETDVDEALDAAVDRFGAHLIEVPAGARTVPAAGHCGPVAASPAAGRERTPWRSLP